MKNSILVVLSAVVISAGTIGGVAFAKGVDDSFKANQQIAAVNTNPVIIDNGNISLKNDGQASSNTSTVKVNDQAKEKENIINTVSKTVDSSAVKINSNIDTAKYNENSANNQSKDVYKNMTNIMRDNGFKDAARYMQTGDFDAMNDYMNTLSQEDYDKMIEIMKNNGYGYMAQMMESIGREGMVEMHNSMGSIPGRGANSRTYNNMMGGF
ncbi:hypothetical protein [Clostridium manihotivorum]|uniref:Uncharacterized protein n=1 Tax=Clostridium manihotivorum TaxID=2320868 RepID=A0A3R5QUS1_9CLOT|nr:hypothetical protein [Clostridium manihotivorum]QAA32816.1 hypothetical protein C1I91_14840 [Clostridium manihotivorum]